MIQRLAAYLCHGGLGPTLIRALAGSAGIRIIGMAFGFLVGVQLAHGLGAAGYGVYGVAMSVISMVTIPIEFGLPQLVTREVSSAQVRQDWEIIRGILGWATRTITLLSVTMAMAGLAAWLLFREKLSDELVYALLPGLLLVFLVPLGNLRGAALRGLQQIVRGQVPEIILRPAVFSSLLLIVSLLLPNALTPALAMAMQVVAAAVTLMAVTLMLQRVFPAMQQIASPMLTDNKAWLSSALPMALTEGMRVFHGNVSILMLGALSTLPMVGVFRVATSMSLLLMMPASLINVVCAPLFSRLHASADHTRLQKMLGWVAAAMVFGVAGLTLPFVFFGERLITTVFGVDFQASNTALLILGIGMLAGCAFGAGATLLNMTGHEKRVAFSFGVSLVALALLSFPLIEYWGADGAALANSISFVLWSTMTWLDARRLLQLDTSLLYFVQGRARFLR
jgi:O-antigen/teichoic acid export membrane protein